MKCNKCLKIIPKGEEIRMYGSGGHSSWSKDYGGNYCEDCWKNKWEYKYHEDGGKANKSSQNVGKNEMPSWGWGVIFALISLSSVCFILLLRKERRD